MTTGCVDYRFLHCSPDYRLALWRIPPFSFRGRLPGCSWLDSTQSVHRRLDEERTSGTGVGGRKNCLVASLSSLERLQPRPPAEDLLSARQKPNTPTRRTGINSCCGSRHIPRTGLGVARIAVPCKLDWKKSSEQTPRPTFLHLPPNAADESSEISNSCLF